MEKQNKIVNAIKRTTNSGQTTPVGTKPNDECYTGMQDISEELSYWADKNKFVGKRIICPCDWDIVEGEDIYSITIEYDPKFKVTGNNAFQTVKFVKLSLFDCFEDDKQVMKEIQLKEDEVEDFLRNKLTCNFVRTLSQNARKWGIQSITASGFNPATGKGIKFQDIDYSKYDICITNPPFSLYSEFMSCILGKIDFICLAPFLNRVNPNVGLPLMLKKCYLGHGRELCLNFKNPNKKNNYISDIKVRCDWITSFDDAQKDVEDEHYTTQIDYNLYKDEYIVFDGMKMKEGNSPIRVPSNKYPYNYDDWMFASVNVLTKLDTTKYEWYGTNFMKYYNTTNPEGSPFIGRSSNAMVSTNSIKGFHGIIFRKKKKNS